VLLAAAQHDLEVREATPNEVKVATAGHGGAGKEQVQRMVQAILGLAEMPTPDDAADALAIAICVANRERSISRIPIGALDRSAINPARAVRRRTRRPFARHCVENASAWTPPGTRRACPNPRRAPEQGGQA